MKDFRVSLINQNYNSQRVVFDATPELVETKNVNYKNVDPVHAPGQIYAYVNSSSRSFNVSSIKLISRTIKEAEDNLNRMWLLRSWTMPAFGRDPLSNRQRENRETLATRQEGPQPPPEMRDRMIRDTIKNNRKDYGTDFRGQPPTVLLLSAYSPTVNGAAHIRRVPVVIQNMSFAYPTDTDYIPSAGGVPMPTIMNIDMTLAETHSPREYENFSLGQFRSGTLRGF